MTSLEHALNVANKDGVYIVEIRPALPNQQWMPRFLELLRDYRGNVQKTLDAAPDEMPSKPTLYKYRRRNPGFRAKWEDVLNDSARSKKAAEANEDEEKDLG